MKECKQRGMDGKACRQGSDAFCYLFELLTTEPVGILRTLRPQIEKATGCLCQGECLKYIEDHSAPSEED